MTVQSPDGTTEVPSRLSILVMAVLTVAALLATLWTYTGPEYDGRHLVGSILGWSLSELLFSQTLGRLGRRMWAEHVSGRCWCGEGHAS